MIYFRNGGSNMDNELKHEVLTSHANFNGADFDFPMHWTYLKNSELPWEMPGHWHDQLEINFTIQGRVEGFNINGEVFNTEPGDVLILNPGDVHSLKKMPQDQEREILTVFFDTDVLLQDISDAKKLRFYTQPGVKNVDETKKLIDSLLRLREYINRPCEKRQDKLVLKNIMYDLLFRIVHEFGYDDDQDNVQIEDLRMSPSFVKEIIDHIKSHISEHISVQALAKKFNISSSYLVRIFKRYMGQTPSEYIRNIRLTHAKQNLLNTNYSIQYISDISGFSSLRTFERTFKTKYRQTPSEYRNFV